MSDIKFVDNKGCRHLKLLKAFSLTSVFHVLRLHFMLQKDIGEICGVHLAEHKV